LGCSVTAATAAGFGVLAEEEAGVALGLYHDIYQNTCIDTLSSQTFYL
jgi:hypothetical protein